jgi:hypothetical protein
MLQGKIPDGAIIAPVILASDKTQLLQFCSDKQAWPVYFMISNIKKETQHKPSAHGSVLVRYIPVTKLDCFTKAAWPLTGYCLFHLCMSKLLMPLVRAGKDGIDMVCANGFI